MVKILQGLLQELLPLVVTVVAVGQGLIHLVQKTELTELII